ncbi:hypothetical protein HYALB_00013454 [Hymenoscyphus albidus]|uniref:Uncharacterized protein n=1 Tax=Hymenoscyphus albidus TaxID=595503 RepID=A0A9N9LUX8_9HELO|nr:hypothetical protein HYALB_00013454 [Hymenoscyphus albidus]
MKFAAILFTSLAAFASVSAAPQQKKAPKGKEGGGGGAAGSVVKGSDTLTFFEVGGIPGNECLTFRNNGDMVNAACVDTAADRQMTPSKNAAGDDVLLLQRSFAAGFRPDLVGVQACLGLTDGTFKAIDCASSDPMVSLKGTQLFAGKACHSGHNGKAEVTVDATGAKCVDVKTKKVKAAAPIE